MLMIVGFQLTDFFVVVSLDRSSMQDESVKSNLRPIRMKDFEAGVEKTKSNVNFHS